MKKLLTFLISICMIFTTVIGVVADGEETLQSKIDSAESGETITLDKDYVESITIPKDKNITIDLNGHTLTGTNGDTIYVTLGGTLNIMSKEGSGSVIASPTTDDKAAIFNNGTTTIYSGVYSRTAQNYYVIVNHGTMTISSGEFKNTSSGDTSSLIENGYGSYNSGNERNGYVDGTNSSAPTLTIKNGSFDAGSGLNVVKNDDGGVLTINDGTFKASSNTTGSIIQNWNKATITGGTFNAEGRACAVSNGGTSGNDNNKGELEITGGTYSADASTGAVFSSGDGSNSGTTKVNGGTYSGATLAVTDVSSNITIEEGSFSSLTKGSDKVSFAGATAEITSDGNSTFAIGNKTINEIVNNATSETTVTVTSGSVTIESTNSNVEIKNSEDNTTGEVKVNGNEVKAGEEVKADVADPSTKEDTKTDTNTNTNTNTGGGSIPCELSGRVWSEAKKQCVYKVSNTSVR